MEERIKDRIDIYFFCIEEFKKMVKLEQVKSEDITEFKKSIQRKLHINEFMLEEYLNLENKEIQK